MQKTTILRLIAFICGAIPAIVLSRYLIGTMLTTIESHHLLGAIEYIMCSFIGIMFGVGAPMIFITIPMMIGMGVRSSNSLSLGFAMIDFKIYEKDPRRHYLKEITSQALISSGIMGLIFAVISISGELEDGHGLWDAICTSVLGIGGMIVFGFCMMFIGWLIMRTVRSKQDFIDYCTS